MPNLKLTDRAVARLPAPDPSGKQTLHWDADLKGFGVLVSGVSTAKTYVVQRKLPGRKTRRITIEATNVIGLDEARRRAMDLLADIGRGIDPKAEAKRRASANVTLRAALDRYVSARPDLSAVVRVSWPRLFELYLRDWLDKPLREIDADAVEDRHRKIMAAVAAHARPRSASYTMSPGAGTANLIMRAFRAVWNHAADSADLPVAPTRRLKRRWAPEPRRDRTVRSDDLPAFYAAVSALGNPRDRDLILLMLLTGLRVGEASSLRWTDLDLAERAIRLPAARTKAGRRLDLPMTTRVRDLLVARRAVGIEGPFVFPAHRRSSGPGHATDIGAAFDAIAAASGVRVSPHDLRRTWATIAEGCDVSGLAMKALLNHSVGGDVTSGYIRMTLDRLRAPAQRVADRIAELCGASPLPEGVTKIG